MTTQSGDDEPTVELRVTSLRTASKKSPDLESTAAGHDPYGTADDRRSHRKKPRRTLDDMRELSEEIKHTRRDSAKEPPE